MISRDVMTPSVELTEAIAEEIMGWSKTILVQHKFVEDDGCLGILHSGCDYCKQPLGEPHAEGCITFQHRWVWRCSDESWPDTGDPKSYVYNSWNPGENIKDAWDIVRTMIKEDVFVYIRYNYIAEAWQVCYSNEEMRRYATVGHANAKTEGLAICKAALFAFGVIE
jgi:hypothetical protein